MLGYRPVDEFADGCRVAHAGVTNEGKRVLSGGLQHGQERVLLLGSLHLCVACLGNVVLVGVLYLELGRLFSWFCLYFGSRAVGRLRCFAVGQATVELLQIRNNLLGVVGFPEFEVRTTLQKLAHAFGFLDTRHLNHNAAGLSFKLLNVGLNDTELVNTGADDIERVVDGCLNFLAEHFLYLRIRTLRIDLALQLLCGKELGEAVSRCILMIVLHEKRDKITLTRLLFSASFLH